MAVAMSPARSFAARAPLALGPVPDIDDLEELELDDKNADSEQAVVFTEGVVVFNIDEDIHDSRGLVIDDLETSCSYWATAEGLTAPAAAHFAIGTPGSSSCGSSLTGSCCGTPVGSERTSLSGMHRGAPLPGELLQAVLKNYNHSECCEDTVDDFDNSVGAFESGSDDDM